MPQFYNGVTRPVTDGVANTGAGSVAAAAIYEDLANDMFAGTPEKVRGASHCVKVVSLIHVTKTISFRVINHSQVVFGFCINDCGGTGSNAQGSEAVQVLQDIKTYTPSGGTNTDFACNGGAFFWVVNDDTGGVWSDTVVAEVSLTAGCSATSFSPSKSPSTSPSQSPSAVSSSGAANTIHFLCLAIPYHPSFD